MSSFLTSRLVDSTTALSYGLPGLERERVMPNTSSMRSMRSPVNSPPRSVWNTSISSSGKRSAANAAGHSVGVVPDADRMPGDLPVGQVAGQADVRPRTADPRVGRVGGQMGARRMAIELAGEDVGSRVVVRLFVFN